MQAIQTKYLGPTNFRGSRVKAMAQSGSVTVGWNDAYDTDDNHRNAALTLAKRLGWDHWTWNYMETGWLKDSTAVHMYVNRG